MVTQPTTSSLSRRRVAAPAGGNLDEFASGLNNAQPIALRDALDRADETNAAAETTAGVDAWMTDLGDGGVFGKSSMRLRDGDRHG